MRFAIGAMSVGDILDRGLKVLMSRIGTFYVIFLIVLSPLFVLQLVLPSAMEAAAAGGIGPGAALLSIALVAIVTLILSPIGTAASTHVIAQEFIGESVSLGEAFSFGLSRFGAVLGTALLAGLLIGLGFVMCLVPGIIFYMWWAFAAGGQIPVVEGLSGTAAMARSKQLTEGFRGRVFGVYFLVALAGGILQNLIQMGLGAALPPYELVPGGGGPFAPPRQVFHFRNYAIQIIIVQLVGILVQTYAAICLTLLYFDLRIRKEGFDLELAARQLRGEAKPES